MILDLKENRFVFFRGFREAIPFLDEEGRLLKFFHLLSFLGLVAFLTWLYSPTDMFYHHLPSQGEIATHPIKSDRDFLIQDEESTRQRQVQAAEKVSPVYDLDGGMMSRIQEQLREALEWLDRTRREKPNASRNEAVEGLSNRLGEAVDAEAMEKLWLLSGEEGGIFSSLQFALVREWLDSLAVHRVVSGPEILRDLEKSTYVVRSLADKSDVEVVGAANVVDLVGMRKEITRSGAIKLTNLPAPVKSWLQYYVRQQVRPNLVLNYAESDERRRKAAQSVEPVFFQVRKGEMLVREGEMVTPEAMLKINALMERGRDETGLLWVAGLGSLIALMLLLGHRFLLVTAMTFPRDRKTLYLLGTILALASSISAFTEVAGQGVSELLKWPLELVEYLPPVALGAGLVSLVVGSRLSLPGGAALVGAFLAFFTSFASQQGVFIFIYHFLGSVVASFTLRSSRQRFDILRSGFFTGLAQMVTVVQVEILLGRTGIWEILPAMGTALASGMLCGVLYLAVLPLLESLFGITTDTRLLELASGDHPLLKQLSLRAPGTYHHSVMMGNLAEDAAKAVGANPLLARVMALYHDIGKMVMPHYFVENQSGENRHDFLTPNMSAKVIMAHVKEGEDLARQYRLGGPVMEAITEHQGTSILQYFYNKALIEAERKGETVQEEEFRYPGPKPVSPEAGIIMLADSVEAAARTLKNPAPAQIRALVRRIVGAKIKDGQLDECRLTMRDVAKVEDAFFRVLTLGFYHHRIAYPDRAGGKRGRGIDGSGSGSNVVPLARRSQ